MKLIWRVTMPILFNRKYLLHVLLKTPSLFLPMLVVPFLSVANDKALYDEVPKDASYVRFINVSETTMKLKFLDKSFDLPYAVKVCKNLIYQHHFSSIIKWLCFFRILTVILVRLKLTNSLKKSKNNHSEG